MKGIKDTTEENKGQLQSSLKDFFKKDLSLCSEWFEKNLGFKSHIYAFPNGSYKESQFKIAIKAGYSEILLVNNNFSSIKNKIHSRFNFYADTEMEMVEIVHLCPIDARHHM